MKRRMTLAAGALLAIACAPDEKYAGLSFEIQSTPPVPLRIESDEVELVAGLAVKVDVAPESDGREYSRKELVSLRARDREIFDVYATGNSRSFVLVGLREGESCLEVRINNREEECIDVRVLGSGE